MSVARASPPLSINFRQLAEDDLPLMHRWLNTDFVAKWWGPRPSLQEVIDKYGPRIRGDVPVRGYIIELDGRPVGYVQAYLISDWPDYARCVGEAENAVGIDLFIGDADLAHRGLGPPVLRKFLREIVFAATDAVSCIIGPAESNTAAIRAYEKTGFRYLKTISVPGEHAPEYLMRITREEVMASS